MKKHQNCEFRLVFKKTPNNPALAIHSQSKNQDLDKGRKLSPLPRGGGGGGGGAEVFYHGTRFFLLFTRYPWNGNVHWVCPWIIKIPDFALKTEIFVCHSPLSSGAMPPGHTDRVNRQDRFKLRGGQLYWVGNTVWHKNNEQLTRELKKIDQIYSNKNWKKCTQGWNQRTKSLVLSAIATLFNLYFF